MRITPISNITFTNSQPIKDNDKKKLEACDYVTFFVEENGQRKEIRMTREEYQEYDKEQKRLKEEKYKQEKLKQEQDWIANINRPQTYHK